MSKTIQLSYCENCGLWNGTESSCKSCKQPCVKKDVPNKRGGQYFITGVDHVLPSVTAVLQVLAKPALTYWLKQKVAEAIFANPTISLQDAINAPDKVRDMAASKGGDIHSIIEASSKGLQISLEEYSEPWKGYVEAYLRFQKEMPHKILKAEHIVYSKKFNYAGQLDAIADIGGTTYLLDYKTSKGVYPKENALQLGAYKLALEEMGTKVDQCAIVHLKPDGTYGFHNIQPESDRFLECLNLYRYQND